MKATIMTKEYFVSLMEKYCKNYLETDKMLNKLTGERWIETEIGSMYWDYLYLICSFFKDVISESSLSSMIIDMIYDDIIELVLENGKTIYIKSWEQLYDYLLN